MRVIGEIGFMSKQREDNPEKPMDNINYGHFVGNFFIPLRKEIRPKHRIISCYFNCHKPNDPSEVSI